MTATAEAALRGGDKKTLRAHFSALRDGLRGEERIRAEATVRERLFALPLWREAPLICGYVSMRGELNTAPIWAQALREGKGYALPVTVTGTREGRMVFRRVGEPHTTPMSAARFGISEPDDTCPTLSLRDFEGAILLVPALAFDREGYRLGYGGGYYDRFLASLREAHIHVTAVGLAFAHCRAEVLPREPFDMPVHLVIDEFGSHSTQSIPPIL